MATIHLIMQGKGGVGKSMIASFLFQYLRAMGIDVMGVDTDPVNRTYAGYKEFNVTEIDIMSGDDIDPTKFDALIDTAMGLPEGAHLVVDNGASCFPPLCSYLKYNAALEMLAEAGHTVYLHAVITGGQALGDTLNGLKTLSVDFPHVPVVVWLNLYFGDISLNGKSFDQMKIYKDHLEQFKAVIEIPNVSRNTFCRDLEETFTARESFDTAIATRKGIMVQQRLKIFWNKLQEVISKANLI